MSQTTVSFGKYKGQPMSVLMNDKSYLKWCQQQSWFQEKFPNLCDTALTENTKPPVVKTTVTKKSAIKPIIVTEMSTKRKIKNLEEENKTLIDRIKHNQLEIQRLKSKSDDDQDDSEEDDSEEDDVKPLAKCVGKCLL